MSIKYIAYKFFFVFSLALIFMISACSKPSEDKELPAKKVAETIQTEQVKVVTPAPEPPKPEILAPSDPKPEPSKPVTPKPVKKSNLVDVITMENPAYPTHKKGIVLFTHKKHVEEYEIGCRECHHDKDGVPLNDLKENDKVDTCILCHSKPGQAPRPKDKKKLSQKEKLEYHAEAIHENCIKCHKEFNKENATKAAPSSCSKCHPKRN
ncbi:MAG: cytochrome c3 family protein [Bacteroidales bacterium]|nr:cytochrome c3 family protein [Bacteroidales bacterium]